jgi:hypothetical protein
MDLPDQPHCRSFPSSGRLSVPLEGAAVSAVHTSLRAWRSRLGPFARVMSRLISRRPRAHGGDAEGRDHRSQPTCGPSEGRRDCLDSDPDGNAARIARGLRRGRSTLQYNDITSTLMALCARVPDTGHLPGEVDGDQRLAMWPTTIAGSADWVDNMCIYTAILCRSALDLAQHET